MEAERKIYIPAGGPPTDIQCPPEIYQRMGEENIFKMLSDFYQELGQSPIRGLFPDDLEEASQKSAAFFVTILGGPPLYYQKYGPPMMRRRHFPFKIDEAARQTWLDCFAKVLVNSETKYKFPTEHKARFWTFLDKFSAWMVNSQ